MEWRIAGEEAGDIVGRHAEDAPAGAAAGAGHVRRDDHVRQAGEGIATLGLMQQHVEARAAEVPTLQRPAQRHAGLGRARARSFARIEDVGVDPKHVVIGHVGNLVDPNTEVHRAICRRGAFVGFDRQGGPGDDPVVPMVMSLIEAGFAASSPGDFDAVAQIARLVKGPRIASLARAVPGDVDAAAEALRSADRPRLHVFLSSSDIHILHQMSKDRETVLNQAVEMVARARRSCSA